MCKIRQFTCGCTGPEVTTVKPAVKERPKPPEKAPVRAFSTKHVVVEVSSPEKPSPQAYLASGN